MYHCHPCFGGYNPVSPVQTTCPVVHPTKQCFTHTFSTTVVPHVHPVHTTNVHHQQIKSQHFFPQTASNVNVVDPVDPGFGGFGGFGGPGSAVSPMGPGNPGLVGGFGGMCGQQVSPYGPGPNVGPNVGGMFKK